VILDQELRRSGLPGIELDSVREIDLLRVWYHAQPRTLESAVKTYLGVELEGSHGAQADRQVLLKLMASIAAVNRSAERVPADRVTVLAGPRFGPFQLESRLPVEIGQFAADPGTGAVPDHGSPPNLKTSERKSLAVG
jgi:hypothetical protein